MSKKISQFDEITNLTGEEYTIVAYPNLNNKKIKLTNIVKVDSTVSQYSNNPVKSSSIFEELSKKQDNLVSGVNIKTINHQSVIGKGNVVINSVTMTVDQLLNGSEIVTTITQDFDNYLENMRFQNPQFVEIKNVTHPATIKITESSAYINFFFSTIRNGINCIETYDININRETKEVQGEYGSFVLDKYPSELTTLFLATNVVSYNPDTELFTVNGIDLNIEEMSRVYDAGQWLGLADKTFQYQERRDIITTLPIRNYSTTIGTVDNTYSFNRLFINCLKLQKIKLFDADDTEIQVSDLVTAFYNCYSLVEISDILDVQSITTYNKMSGIFTKCSKLETVRIKNIKASIDMSASEHITLESFKYLCDNAQNTNVITVRVNNSIYNKFTDTTGNYQDWVDLKNTALSKNIQFIL